MKTRLKTFPKNQNKSILENRNFLNSQNYILGKKEKKKILSKFFIEKIVKYNYFNLLNIFYIITNLLFILFGLLIHVGIIIFILYLIYIDIFDRNYKNSGLILLLPILLIVLGMLIGWKKYFKFKPQKIKSVKQYFSGPKLFSFNSKIKTNDFKERININPKGIIYILFLLISIILIPIFLLILFINIIISLINIFLFRGINGYKFIKYSYKSSLISKFKEFNKESAENNFYKIQLKN